MGREGLYGHNPSSDLSKAPLEPVQRTEAHILLGKTRHPPTSPPCTDFHILTSAKCYNQVTPSGRVIAESSAIASYLLSTYDTAKKFQGDGGPKNDWIRDESLTSFSGSSLGPITLLKLLLAIAELQTPFLLRPLVRLVTGGMDRLFSGPELKQMLTYLEGEIAGQSYFMGAEPGRADFMLSFPLDMVDAFRWTDWREYEGLRAWRERCQGREAWKRALEKGNGYNLAFGGDVKKG